MHFSRTTDVKAIFALTLVHFTGDFYSSFAIPLIPTFIERHGLNLWQVGVITGFIRLLAFVVQPTVGYFADRSQTRFFALGGLLLTILFIPLAGVAPTFIWLLLCLATGSFGSSMFHPAVTGMVPVYAGKNAGFSMSIFNTGGTLAFGLGPIFITWFVDRFGLHAMPATMAIGAAVMAYLIRVLPMPPPSGADEKRFWAVMQDMLGDVWRPVLLIWIVMVLRAATGQAYMTFITVLLSQKGFPLIAIGAVTSIFVVAGTMSGMLAGFFSDRFEFKSIFFAAHAMMVPTLLFLLYARGVWVYAAAFLAGFFVLATLPLGVVMAQELAPRGRSMVSSLMMGFAYGLGGATTPLTGRLSDSFGIETVLFYIAFVPLVTVMLICFFPRMRS